MVAKESSFQPLFLAWGKVLAKVESSTMKEKKKKKRKIWKNSLSRSLPSKSTGPVEDIYLCFADKKLKHQATTWFDQDDAEKTSTVKIRHLNVVPKYHFEVRRRFENHGAVPVETVRVTTKSQPTTCLPNTVFS